MNSALNRNFSENEEEHIQSVALKKGMLTSNSSQPMFPVCCLTRKKNAGCLREILRLGVHKTPEEETKKLYLLIQVHPADYMVIKSIRSLYWEITKKQKLSLYSQQQPYSISTLGGEWTGILSWLHHHYASILYTETDCFITKERIVYYSCRLKFNLSGNRSI